METDIERLDKIIDDTRSRISDGLVVIEQCKQQMKFLQERLRLAMREKQKVNTQSK